jgi:hypothetical protein
LKPLTIEKERCRAKQKQKQKQKQSGPFFFGLDVFFGVAISFFHSKIGLSFPSFGQWQLIRIGPNVCCVPVLISGIVVRAGSSDEPRSRTRTDAIYLAPDPGLGPDPSPGSAVCRSGFSVNLRRQSFDF